MLNIPKQRSVALIISIGYPPEDYKIRRKKRKILEEIMAWNAYDGQSKENE